MDARHYRRELVLDAPPAAVYALLATPHGLRRWWTKTCAADTAVGGQATFRFGPHWKVMAIERLEPNRAVVWRCIDAHLDVDAFARKDEWVGTTIRFALTPSDDGGATRLEFEHLGLTPALQCHSICVDGWNRYLDSLRAEVERGEGHPFDPDGAPCAASSAVPIDAALAHHVHMEMTQ